MAKKSSSPTDTHTQDHTHSKRSSTPSLPIAPNTHVTVTLKWSIVEPAYQKAIRRYAREVKIDGFRKGKVPLSMVESMVKPSALTEYVLQLILPEAYSQAIKQADKHPISQPEIEPVQIEKGKDWVLTASFAETPQVKLGKYQDIVKKALKVADKDIANQEAELAKRAKAPEKEEKKAEEKTKEEAQQPSQPTTLTDQQKEELRTRQVFHHLAAEINPQIPELLVRREADREVRRLLEQLDQLKLSVEKYLESRQMTAEQLRLEYLSSATTSLQLEFILAEIGKTEKIFAENTEVDQMLQQVFGEKLTDTQKQNSDYRSYAFNTLVKQKIVKHLLSL